MEKIKVLFLCTGNSCRSQMAEGLAKHLKGDAIEAYSAGTAPKVLDPLAIEVMGEIGIDITNQRSKHVSELAGMQFDCIVTLCGSAKEECVSVTGKFKRIHKGFDDPPALSTGKTHSQALEIYGRVRDEIKEFALGMPERLIC